MLNVSLASTGRINLNKEAVDIVRLVASILKRYDEEIRQVNCEIEFKSDNKIIVTCDPLRIEQIVINLLTNALKHGRGKLIEIMVSNSDNQVSVSIKNQGETIPKKQQKEIFEPFKRVGNTKATKGLGVGLFIAKRLALAHGGDIYLKSDINTGTVFTLRFPDDQK